MSKVGKLELAWRNGAIKDVKEEEMLTVLRKHEFELRRDRGNHWLAEHPRLKDHPQFGLGGKVGRIKVNCHCRGQQGLVHPFAVKEVLLALDTLRELEN